MTTPHDSGPSPSEPTTTTPAPKLCGRETRGGRPCRQRIPDPRFEVACRQHAADAETELATARRAAYRQGYRDAQESIRGFADFRIEQLQQRISELEQAAKPPRRMTEPTGRQIVEVGGHAYAWGGPEPLTVGDEVWLPANDVSRVRIGARSVPRPGVGSRNRLHGTAQADHQTHVKKPRPGPPTSKRCRGAHADLPAPEPQRGVPRSPAPHRRPAPIDQRRVRHPRTPRGLDAPGVATTPRHHDQPGADPCGSPITAPAFSRSSTASPDRDTRRVTGYRASLVLVRSQPRGTCGRG